MNSQTCQLKCFFPSLPLTTFPPLSLHRYTISPLYFIQPSKAKEKNQTTKARRGIILLVEVDKNMIFPAARSAELPSYVCVKSNLMRFSLFLLLKILFPRSPSWTWTVLLLLQSSSPPCGVIKHQPPLPFVAPLYDNRHFPEIWTPWNGHWQMSKISPLDIKHWECIQSSIRCGRYPSWGLQF